MLNYRTASRRAAVLALAAALSLSACSEIPDTVSTVPLKELAADARAQVETILADTQELTDKLGDVPADIRSAADDAAAAARDGSAKAQAALDNAEVSGEGAQQEMDEAEQALDDATAKLTALKDSVGAEVKPTVTSAIDDLQAEVSSLKQKIIDASS